MKLAEIQSDILQLKFSQSPIVTCDIRYVLELLYFIEKVLKEKHVTKKKKKSSRKRMQSRLKKRG